MKLQLEQAELFDNVPQPIPFPRARLAHTSENSPSRFGDDVLAAFNTVSRRMQDLARELGCLGFFEEDSDRPRAA